MTTTLIAQDERKLVVDDVIARKFKPIDSAYLNYGKGHLEKTFKLEIDYDNLEYLISLLKLESDDLIVVDLTQMKLYELLILLEIVQSYQIDTLITPLQKAITISMYQSPDNKWLTKTIQYDLYHGLNNPKIKYIIYELGDNNKEISAKLLQYRDLNVEDYSSISYDIFHTLDKDLTSNDRYFRHHERLMLIHDKKLDRGLIGGNYFNMKEIKLEDYFFLIKYIDNCGAIFMNLSVEDSIKLFNIINEMKHGQNWKVLCNTNENFKPDFHADNETGHVFLKFYVL